MTRASLAIIQTILSWVGPVFSSLGYVLIFVATLLESSAFVGVVVPGDVILAIGGIYAARGDLSLPLVIVIGIVGTACGESIGFWLGDRYGESLVRRLPFADRLQGKINDARAGFDRNASKVLLIGRFASGLRVMVPFTAGMSDISYPNFMAFVIPTATVWAVGVSRLGYFLGANVQLIDTILSRFGWGVLALVIIGVGGRIAFRKLRERRKAPTS
jgi:membrane-associated protein